MQEFLDKSYSNTEIINCVVMVVWEETVTSIKSCLTAFILLPPFVGGTWKENAGTEIKLAETICNTSGLETSLLKGIISVWYLYG